MLFKFMPTYLYLRLAAFILSIVIFTLGYICVNMGLSERETTFQFKNYGVRVPATLIGYRYFEKQGRRPAGDRPVFSYVSNDGTQHTYVASDYGVATNLKKKVLSTQKLIITYLPDNPDYARIEKWNRGSSGILYITLGTLMCIGAFGFIYEGMRIPFNP